MGCTQSSKSVTGITDPKDKKAAGKMDKAGKPADGKQEKHLAVPEHEESKTAIETKHEPISAEMQAHMDEECPDQGFTKGSVLKAMNKAKTAISYSDLIAKGQHTFDAIK